MLTTFNAHWTRYFGREALGDQKLASQAEEPKDGEPSYVAPILRLSRPQSRNCGIDRVLDVKREPSHEEGFYRSCWHGEFLV